MKRLAIGLVVAIGIVALALAPIRMMAEAIVYIINMVALGLFLWAFLWTMSNAFSMINRTWKRIKQ